MKVKLKNGKTLVFEEGCFDQFEGDQEELEALRQAIIEEFESLSDEELEAKSVPYHGDIPDPETRQ